MMYNKIEAKHTCTVIHNYRKGNCVKLEHFFSMWDKAYFRYYPKAIRYDQDKKELIIPRGYPLKRLEFLFNSRAFVNRSCDPYDFGLQLKLRYLPRDMVQKEAISFITGKGKYSYTAAKSQLAINLNTGAGKTYVTVVASAILGLRAIMITSSLDWIRQWKDRITEYTDTQPNEIYELVGSASIAKVLNGMVHIKDYKYILASHQTIKSYGDKYGWNKVGELFCLLRVGIKIYDEAHLDFDNICDIDFSTDTYKTLYLTATPARSDRDENVIYQASFQTVPAIDLFNDETDPRTNYLAISYTSHPTPMDVERCKNLYGFDRLAYCSYIIHKPEFYKLIRSLIELILKKGKTLIYLATNEAIMTVYVWLCHSYPELANDIGIYTTLIKDKQQKRSMLDKMIILSTTKSCGAAMDIKGLKMTIVLAEPFRSEVLARQTLGRTRDNNTDYVEIIDRGFFAMTNYYKAKYPIFQKYALSMSFSKLSDYDLDDMYYKALRLQQLRYQANNSEKKLVNFIHYDI